MSIPNFKDLNQEDFRKQTMERTVKSAKRAGTWVLFFVFTFLLGVQVMPFILLPYFSPLGFSPCDRLYALATPQMPLASGRVIALPLWQSLDAAFLVF